MLFYFAHSVGTVESYSSSLLKRLAGSTHSVLAAALAALGRESIYVFTGGNFNVLSVLRAELTF